MRHQHGEVNSKGYLLLVGQREGGMRFMWVVTERKMLWNVKKFEFDHWWIIEVGDMNIVKYDEMNSADS